MLTDGPSSTVYSIADENKLTVSYSQTVPGDAYVHLMRFYDSDDQAQPRTCVESFTRKTKSQMYGSYIQQLVSNSYRAAISQVHCSQK